MTKISKRRAFLERVSCQAHGKHLNPLGLDTEFTRNHIETACQALSMKLVSLVEEDDEGGYAFRITRVGMLLLDCRVEEAAALIDSGFRVRRVVAPPPWGQLASKLRPGGAGISLKGNGPRAYGTQIILAVASGQAIVMGDVVRGNANVSRISAIVSW